MAPPMVENAPWGSYEVQDVHQVVAVKGLGKHRLAGATFNLVHDLAVDRTPGWKTLTFVYLPAHSELRRGHEYVCNLKLVETSKEKMREVMEWRARQKEKQVANKRGRGEEPELGGGSASGTGEGPCPMDVDGEGEGERAVRARVPMDPQG